MIHVEGLTHTYPGAEAPAIRDLAFAVGEGEVFGFLGPSGAGKSTTQHILTGLLRGWTGTVEVLGRSISDCGADYYRTIGVSFEYPNHYLKLTATENLAYFRALHDDTGIPLVDALRMVGLDADAHKLVGAFSKGMKTRLNLARSLLHQPRLWFLDEPTTGLDPVNATRIREIIQERQRQGVTVVLTTHDMNTADAVCDRVAFIVDGQIAAIDAPATLRRRFGTRQVAVTWADEAGSSQREEFPMDGLADNAAFAMALRQPGLTSVHSQEATLEDVFVQVTGRTLR